MATRAFHVPTQQVLADAIQKGSIQLKNVSDPFSRFITNTTERVVRGNGIGRDWKVIKPIDLGTAGAFKWREMTAGPLFQNNSLGTVQIPSEVRAFPGYTEVSLVGYDNLELALVEGFGNFMIPHALLRANMLSQTAVDMLAKNIMGAARKKAEAELRAFYANDGTYKYLATVGEILNNGSGVDYDGDGSDAGQGFVKFIPANGRVYMFSEGDFVSFHDSTAGQNDANLDDSKVFVITHVDPVNKHVSAKTTTGEAITTAVAAGDEVHMRGSAVSSNQAYTYAPEGLNSWIKSSGSVVGIALTDVPRLTSFVKAVTAPLSETIFNAVLGDYADAYGPRIDNAVTTSGALNAFVENLRNPASGLITDGEDEAKTAWNYERGKGDMSLTGGFAGYRHVYGGKVVKVWASPYCQDGTLYACQTANGNLKRYAPPRVKKMASHSAFGDEVEFLAGIGGGGPFKNVHNGDGATTDYVEAPFSCCFNIMATHPQGIKLTSLEEINYDDLS